MSNINILPADTYIVINKTILTGETRRIINMLYQPIIGSIPVMLYFSLWSDLDKMGIMSEDYTHHHLLSHMQMSINEIETSRKKLEAIGLLKSYVKEGNVNSYIYELYSPLSAHDFFNNPILNIVLYNNVGKNEYTKLVEFFKYPRINKIGYEDVTVSFNDVFDSIPLTSYDLVHDDIRKYNKAKLNINSNFDFNFLMESMPNSLNKSKIFTKENKELILNLSYIYDLDVMKMQHIIKGCINERETISKEELRKACRNYYQFDNGGALPTIVSNIQPEYLRAPLGDTSKRSKMIYTFDTTSPSDLLRSKNGGNEPTKRDLKLVEDLIVEYGLKPGVVNVLIDYTLKTQNNKLSRNFVETIAGQWKRLNIETVEEAMSLAEKEHKKYNKNKTDKVKVKSNIHIEKIPSWFDKKVEKESYEDFEQNEIEELLKEYK